MEEWRDYVVSRILCAKRESHPSGCKRGDIKLPVSSDTEQAAAKGNGARESRENQRRGIEWGVTNSVRPGKRAAYQQLVSLNWTVANDENDDAANNERRDDGDSWKQNFAPKIYQGI